MLAMIDRQMYRADRASAAPPAGDAASATISSRCCCRRATRSGQLLTDQELRDELMALLLAGHETTANSLAWAFERLLRTPDAYDRLRELVRDGGREADAYVEATIHETMRNRPVIPMIVRTVKRRWRFGEYVVAAEHAGRGLDHRPASPRRRLSAAAGVPPERFLTASPGPTRGSRSGAESGAAWGRRWRWPSSGSCWRRSRGGPICVAAGPRARAARMRNVTMIPRRGAGSSSPHRRAA